MARKKSGEMTKTEAVKQALAEGVDNPTDAVAFIKDKFGLDITNQQFSTYKSLAKKAAADGAVPAERPATTAAAAPKARNVAHTNGTSDDPAALARTVKQIVAQYGADAVKNMTDVFAD